VSTELETARDPLPDVLTGEVLPAVPENMGRVIEAAREKKRQLDDLIALATEILREESERLGTKTFHFDRKVSLSGGPSVEYDAHDLREALTEAGCPEERISAAIQEEISYKVDRSVLKQLAAANPDYKAAIELAERPVEKRWSAKVS
jgi:hypothetical protein